MEQVSQRVVVGMDPHKRSVTVEVMDADEQVPGGGRFGTDADGYRSMLDYPRRWPDRVWAIERCSGIGRDVALRLRPRSVVGVADGEELLDARARPDGRAGRGSWSSPAPRWSSPLLPRSPPPRTGSASDGGRRGSSAPRWRQPMRRPSAS